MVTRCPSVLQLLPEYFRTPVNKPHTLTEKERNSSGFGKRGDHGEETKALSLATRSFTWKVSFGNPCSIRVPSVARLNILSKMKDFFL